MFGNNMPSIIPANIQNYINSCSAANAYSSNSYPRQYTNTNRSRYVGGENNNTMPRDRRSAAMPPPSYSSSSRPSRRSAQYAPPDLSRLRIAEEPPPSRPRPSRRATPPSPPPPSTRERRKSVRFDAAPTVSASSGSMPVPRRPKTFATDAPPAAISESAKETARRLYHRKDSDGGPVRSSARPGPDLKRTDSTWTMNTTQAEAGTTIGRGGGKSSRGGDRESDRHRRDRPSRRR